VRRRKITRKERTGASGSKAKYDRGIIATDTIASNMAKETESSLIVDTNRTCTDGRN